MRCTPGPWLSEKLADGKIKIETVGLFESYHRNSTCATCRGNLSLILAAPELLEALKRIEKGCSFPEDEVQRTIRDVARQAISKATGTES